MRNGGAAALGGDERLHVRPAAEGVNGEGDGEEQAGHGDGELEHVDEGRGHHAAGGAVNDGDRAADEASFPLGDTGDGVEDPRDGDELGGEDGERSEPEEDGDEELDGAAVAELEEVLQRGKIVLAGDSPEAGAEELREQHGADGRGADPPPGGHAEAIADAGSTDGGTGADVGGEEGGEEASGAEAAARDQEVGGVFDAAAHKDAERHEEDGVGKERHDVDVHEEDPGDWRPRSLTAVIAMTLADWMTSSTMQYSSGRWA